MITVTVDCNSDRIELDNGDGTPLTFGPIRQVTLTQSILEELLNMLDRSGTRLVRIDEDTSRTLGEW